MKDDDLPSQLSLIEMPPRSRNQGAESFGPDSEPSPQQIEAAYLLADELSQTGCGELRDRPGPRCTVAPGGPVCCGVYGFVEGERRDVPRTRADQDRRGLGTLSGALSEGGQIAIAAAKILLNRAGLHKRQ